MINKDTKLFFSISSKPGNFGASLYNKFFKEFNLNSIYIPVGFNNKTKVNNFMEGIYDIVSGVSVSMPFKKLMYSSCAVIKSIECQYTKNCNTLLFKDDNIEAHNTDCFGFEESCKDLLLNSKTATIFGNGAVADSIQYILKKYNIDFKCFGRLDIVPISESEGDLLINATPLGMDGIKDNVFNKKNVEKYKYIFDVVVNKETNLIKLARDLNKDHISGTIMCLYQFQKQFELYTGIKLAVAQIFQELQTKGFL
jgi:shikimate 5-dehydrogenase